MDMPRYPAAEGGWIQAVNKLQYNAFWLRDAAVIANAFDIAGLHDLAAQDLNYFPAWQRGDGLFISRADQYDGFGEALWAIGQHALRARDRAFAADMLPAVRRALGWFEQERAGESLGLMPTATPGDNELATGHITGDDFWAAAGVQSAVVLARLADRDDLARQWQADLDSFVADLRAQLARAEALTGGWIPPTLEANGGEDWGNLWAAYPAQVVLPAGDPAVTAALAHARSHFREGIATYFHGRLLHDYLGFRVFETELERGEQPQVVDGLYSELAHTTATGGGFEYGRAPPRPPRDRREPRAARLVRRRVRGAASQPVRARARHRPRADVSALPQLARTRASPGRPQRRHHARPDRLHPARDPRWGAAALERQAVRGYEAALAGSMDGPRRARSPG